MDTYYPELPSIPSLNNPLGIVVNDNRKLFILKEEVNTE